MHPSFPAPTSAASRPAASIIISIYKDIEALECIFVALEGQSAKSFEVIVSEDGQDENVAAYIAANRHRFPHLQHLQQEDVGFRKNRALNRAVAAAKGDIIIFIDGDCVPHQRFIEYHIEQAARGIVNAGRRVELGPKYSSLLRTHPHQQDWLNSNLVYLLKVVQLHLDHVSHYEDGLISRTLYQLVKNRRISLLGCNFSCYRDDLLQVNGFDEQYQSPGIGEDVDIEYRMIENGCTVRSIKQLSVVFHLDHKRGYTVAESSRAILRRTKQEHILRPANGISQYL